MTGSDDRHPWWLWATGAACLGVVAFAWSGQTSSPSTACQDAAAFMADVWETPTRARLEAKSPADAERMDSLATAWTRERTEVCHGARAGAETPARWSARRRCLERWAERFDAGVELADSSQVSLGAVAAVLQPPTRCRDVVEPAPLPAEPGRLAQVLSGRRHLSRAEVLMALGEWGGARNELTLARDLLDASGYVSLKLEVELWEAAIPPGAPAVLIDVGARATAAGETTTAARALALAALMHARGPQVDNEVLTKWARAAVERSSDPLARAWWQAAQDGDLDAARARLADALGPDHALVSTTLPPASSVVSR